MPPIHIFFFFILRGLMSLALAYRMSQVISRPVKINGILIELLLGVLLISVNSQIKLFYENRSSISVFVKEKHKRNATARYSTIRIHKHQPHSQTLNLSITRSHAFIIFVSQT